MDSSKLIALRKLLIECSVEEQETIFRELRQSHLIHEFEEIIGAPAEMILEAVHRAPELTRRMLRGVIADAAFRMNVIPSLSPRWTDVTPEGNFPFDYRLADGAGPVSVQVKLQRSVKGQPVVKDGARYRFSDNVYTVETQKTRSGSDGDDNKTRPYKYGEFDILAVSMQPSTGRWDRYLFTPGRWLLVGKLPTEMATIQPVTMGPSQYWTDDFNLAVSWLRGNTGTRMSLRPHAPKTPLTRKKAKKPTTRKPSK